MCRHVDVYVCRHTQGWFVNMFNVSSFNLEKGHFDFEAGGWQGVSIRISTSRLSLYDFLASSLVHSNLVHVVRRAEIGNSAKIFPILAGVLVVCFSVLVNKPMFS